MTGELTRRTGKYDTARAGEIAQGLLRELVLDDDVDAAADILALAQEAVSVKITQPVASGLLIGFCLGYGVGRSIKDD